MSFLCRKQKKLLKPEEHTSVDRNCIPVLHYVSVYIA